MHPIIHLPFMALLKILGGILCPITELLAAACEFFAAL